MTTLITIGNLTKDAEILQSPTGKEYVLFKVAENVFKRDENGKILKNEHGNYITLKTMFYSIFVNEHSGIVPNASNLKKGDLVKVIGKANISIEKDKNGFNNMLVDSISAYSIDANPFNKVSELLETDITE